MTIAALRDTHLVGPASPSSTTRARSSTSSTSQGGVGSRLRARCRGEPSTRSGATRRSRSRAQLAQLRRPTTRPRSSSTAPSSARPQRRRARVRLARACRLGSRPTSGTTPTACAIGRSMTRRSGSRARPRTPTRRRWRSRPGSARAAASPTTRPRRTRPGTPPLVQFVTKTKRGLLPALRRRDGPHAPLPRDSGTGRRRLHERALRQGARRPGRSTTASAHLGRGLVQGLRLAPVRSDAGPRDAGRALHDLLRLVRRGAGR